MRLGKQRVETLQIMQSLLGVRLINTSTLWHTGQIVLIPKVRVNRYGEEVLRFNRQGEQMFTREEVVRERRTPMSEWMLEWYEPKGWANHPAVRMWRFHLGSLMKYQKEMCEEWVRRGYFDTCYHKSKYLIERVAPRSEKKAPVWLGDKDFHQSHRSNLVSKMPEHYQPLFPDTEPGLDYVWPVQG